MRPNILSLALLSSLTVSAYATYLSPSSLNPEMTPVEQQYYNTIKGNATPAQNFLITRDYVRKAQAVVSGEASPSSFPAKKPFGFSVTYLLPDDASTINTALGMYLTDSAGSSPWLA